MWLWPQWDPRWCPHITQTSPHLPHKLPLPLPSSNLQPLIISPDWLHSWLGERSPRCNHWESKLHCWFGDFYIWDTERPRRVVCDYLTIWQSLKYLDNWMPGRVARDIIAAETLTTLWLCMTVWPFTNPPPVWLETSERPPQTSPSPHWPRHDKTIRRILHLSISQSHNLNIKSEYLPFVSTMSRTLCVVY